MAPRRAIVGGRTLRGDHMLVALGAEFALDALPGLAEAGLTFCTLDGATRLRAALESFSGGHLVVLTAAPAYKCPAAPYEAAMLLEAEARRRGIRGKVEIAVYSPRASTRGPNGALDPGAGLLNSSTDV